MEVYTLEDMDKLDLKMYDAEMAMDVWGKNDDLHGCATIRKIITRLEKIKQLLVAGVDTVENAHQGIVVNDRYIIAVKFNKWRIKGKGRWYQYHTIQNLVDKHISRAKMENNNG